MTKDDAIEALRKCADFAHDDMAVENLLVSRHHECWLFPKFHVELVPAELCFARQKQHCRAECKYNLASLRKNVTDSLLLLTPDFCKKCFNHCLDYARAYKSGDSVDLLRATLKTFKSHRKVGTSLDGKYVPELGAELLVPERK